MTSSSASSSPIESVPPRAIFRRKSVAPNQPYQLPTLDQGIQDFRTVLDSFFDNQFLEALSIVNQWERKSLYHTFGKAILCYANALVSNDHYEFELAEDAIMDTLKLCINSRRKTSVFDVLSQVLTRESANYESYTDGEVHAELIAGQARLMNASLEFLRTHDMSRIDKTIQADIQGCAGSFKLCLEVLASRQRWQSEQSKADFKSGLHFSVGLLNLLLASLPAKPKAQLADAGCQGDHELGIHYLELACDSMDEGCQKPLALIATVAFNLWLNVIFDYDEGDSKLISKLLEDLQSTFPKSALVTYLSARSLLIRGSFNQAAQKFKEAINCQQEWQQLQNACHKQLMWINALQQDWGKAAHYCRRLISTSTSPELNYYQLASFLYEKSQTSTDDNSNSEMDVSGDQIKELLQKVMSFKDLDMNELSLTGRVALCNARRVLDNRGTMLAPGLELLCLNQSIKTLAFAKDRLNQFLERADDLLTQVVNDQDLMAELDDEVGPSLDDYANLKLLKAMCLRYLGRTAAAADQLKDVLERKHRLSEGSPIAGIAGAELGTMLIAAGQFSEGRFWLKTAKNDASQLAKSDSSYLLRIEKGLDKSAMFVEMIDDGESGTDIFKRRSSAANVFRRVSLTFIKSGKQKRSNSIGYQHSEMFQ